MKSKILDTAIDFYQGHISAIQFSELFVDLFYSNKQSADELEAEAEASIFLAADAYSVDVPEQQEEVTNLGRISACRLKLEVGKALSKAKLMQNS